MNDKCVQYINKAPENGQRVERRYSNGLNYIFVWEPDGWISIFQRNDFGEYRTIIQAKDIEHAESYIALIEPIPPGAKLI